MLQKLFYLIVATIPLCAHSENIFYEKKLFGSKLSVETMNVTDRDIVAKKIEELADKAKYFIDPDCRWRAKNPDCANPFPEETQKLQAKADQLKIETKGIFNIDTPKGRDFAGLSQGYFIDSIKAKLNLVLDFSGDIYFSGGFESQGGFGIGEPFLPKIVFAKVKMNSGWMIAGSSAKLGAAVYKPKTSQIKMSDDFLQVVLFAPPDFEGYRLDAWATALISGGKGLLSHLESLPQYKGKWTYFYFDRLGNPHCSKRLVCHLDSKSKSIEIRL